MITQRKLAVKGFLKGGYILSEINKNEAARKARIAYYRQWRAKNRDRTRQYNQTYWQRRALREAENAQHNENVREVKENDT
jgi:hypothetical protein